MAFWCSGHFRKVGSDQSLKAPSYICIDFFHVMACFRNRTTMRLYSHTRTGLCSNSPGWGRWSTKRDERSSSTACSANTCWSAEHFANVLNHPSSMLLTVLSYWRWISSKLSSTQRLSIDARLDATLWSAAEGPDARTSFGTRLW